MVQFKVSKVLSEGTYNVQINSNDKEDKMFQRAVNNLNSMVNNGHPVRVVSPERTLTSKEIEEYRRYFCKRAKEDKCNYIYFNFPVKLFKLISH